LQNPARNLNTTTATRTKRVSTRLDFFRFAKNNREKTERKSEKRKEIEFLVVVARKQACKCKRARMGNASAKKANPRTSKGRNGPVKIGKTFQALERRVPILSTPLKKS